MALFGMACSTSSGLNRTGGDSAPEYHAGDPLGDDDDDGGDDDEQTDTSGPGVLNLDPSPDATDHHYRSPLSVTFTAEASGTSITIYDSEGSTLPTEETWHDDGSRVWIEPQPRLDPDSNYAVEIALGGQVLAFEFRTSRVGLLDDEVDIAGAVFSLDLSTVTVSSPGGLGSNADPLASRVPLLQLGDAIYGGTSLKLGLGTNDAGDHTQDLCSPVGSVMADGGVTLDQALVTADVELLAFQLGDATVELEQALLEFDVLPAGEGLTQLGIAGYLRATSLNTLLDTDAACELVAGSSTGVCELCPLGDGECLWTEFGGISGDRIELALDTEAWPEVDGCPEGTTTFLGCSTQGEGGANLLALLFSAIVLGYRRRSA